MRPDLDLSRAPDSSVLSLRRGALILLAALFAGLVLFRGFGVWWQYGQATRETHEQSERLAVILSHHLQQTVATVDATFMHLIEHSRQVGGPAASSQEWSKVIEAALAGLSGIDRISIIDRAGLIRHSTRPTYVGIQRKHLPAFEQLSAAPDSGLIAEGILRDPDSGRLNLTIARSLKSRSGEFDGIAAAFLDPQLLDSFYRDIDFGQRSAIAILTRDGEVLYRSANASSLIELVTEVRKMNLLPEGDPHRDGLRLTAPLEPDGERYFTSVRALRNAQLVVSVSLSSNEMLEAWRKEFIFSALVIATVAVLFLVGGAMFSRAMRERAEADEAIKKNEARFYEIIYRAPIFASVKDREGRVRFINEAMEKLFKTTWKEAVGKRLKEVSSNRSGSIDMISALDQEVVERKIPIQREITYPTSEGSRTALFVKFPLFDEKGEVDSIASFSMDLTDQRRAATWFSTVMDHAPAMIALKDIDGRFVFVNRALAETSGLKKSDFIGRRTGDLFPPDYAAAHDQFDCEVIEARAPIQREFRVPYAPGERTALFVKFPVFDAKGNIESIGSIATDITDQKRAEKQLAHAQRMEAVGQLTGGIAHDFNNLLTVMIGNAELLTDALAGNERLEPLARVTLEAAERSAALTQRLLAFGRRQTLESRSTDVKKLVDDMESLCKRAAGVRVEVEVRCAEAELWPAMVDATQLETAIINLVVNSRDAMPDGGRVVIDLSNFTVDNGYVALNPDAKRGDYVVIAVSDTGTGMPPEVVARVFEPFFTTKEAGKGTGLGLPTIYGFIRQSGGHIKIYSEVGHGTVVRLFLPRADAPSIVPSLRDPASELPRGTERILLVEDDRIVRDHTEAQLVDLGYQVTVASGADQAMRISRLTGRPDLLITDVMMAGSINGRDLALRLRKRWPDLRVLCVSGYTDGVLPDVIDGKFDNMYFLAKPFRRRDLAVKVREAIEARPALAV